MISNSLSSSVPRMRFKKRRWMEFATLFNFDIKVRDSTANDIIELSLCRRNGIEDFWWMKIFLNNTGWRIYEFPFGVSSDRIEWIRCFHISTENRHLSYVCWIWIKLTNIFHLKYNRLILIITYSPHRQNESSTMLNWNN